MQKITGIIWTWIVEFCLNHKTIKLAGLLAIVAGMNKQGYINDDTAKFIELVLSGLVAIVLRNAIRKTAAPPVVKMLFLAAPLLILMACSTYRVTYEEIAVDGSSTSISMTEMVPPGGKKLSEGAVTAKVGQCGEWELGVGAKADTDATGTADLIKYVMDRMFDAGLAAGKAGAVAP